MKTLVEVLKQSDDDCVYYPYESRFDGKYRGEYACSDAPLESEYYGLSQSYPGTEPGYWLWRRPVKVLKTSNHIEGTKFAALNPEIDGVTFFYVYTQSGEVVRIAISGEPDFGFVKDVIKKYSVIAFLNFDGYIPDYIKTPGGVVPLKKADSFGRLVRFSG